MSVPRRPIPWRLYGPLLAGAVVFAIYSVVWMQGAAQMRRSIDDWAAEQRAAGVNVRFDSIATGGFPFFLRGAVNNVAIGDGGAWSWRAPRLHVDALPLAPDRLVFSAGDGHDLDIAGAGRWHVDAPDGRASIAGDKRRLWIVDVESGAGRIENANGAWVSAERFLLTVAPAEGDHDTIEASLAIVNLLARNGASDVSAPKVEAMIAVRNSAALERGAEAWRAAGGDVELRRIYIEAGGGKLALAGVVAIDDAGRPRGVLNAETVNPGALARVLGGVGVVDAQDVEALAATLSLAAIASGGKLKAPLVLENGYARIAGVKLFKLPQVYAAIAD